MKTYSRGFDKSSMERAITAVIGIAVNVLLAYLTYRLELPLYLDTIGTIAVSAVGGLFPGIMTAVASNVFCCLFNPNAGYFAIISVLIAICTAWFARRDLLRRAYGIILLILSVSVISGGLGALIQLALLGGPQFASVAQAADAMGIDPVAAFLLINTGMSIVDKAISALAALGAVHLIPPEKRSEIWNSGWRQKPLSDGEIKSFKGEKIAGKRSLQTRMTVMVILAAVTLSVVMGFVSVRLYYANERAEYMASAKSAARFAAEIVDPERIDEYLSKGEAAEGYAETKKLLYSIRESSVGVQYLYIVKIREDGCYFVFDLETDGMPAYGPGEKAEFEDAFKPYLPALFAGKEIEPIESDDISGWVLTVYHPIRNAAGKTVCYAGADVSMTYLSGYIKDFLLRALFTFSGFFIMVMAYGLWVSRIFLVYPINSMAACAEGFTEGSGDQSELDENVKKLRALDIRTGDEVEKLYRALCKMTLNTAEQMRDIRHFAEVNNKMQNGLIVTMADMVENRDSDTGAHVQKTAAYVRIILNGLKQKGYYAEKLTERYMSDVAMSAPLHDVGKISIPDAVLNKPGKLTDEDYEIMK
ncbi:MAG: diguanylate cyclase, partial [Oscillospiraceae bacterium]|nr:diguanylate cyclase [Oscillospiraceae bacterium]